MMTGMFRRSFLPSKQTLSAALSSFDSCLSYHFTSAATGISVEPNMIRTGSTNTTSCNVSPRFNLSSISKPFGVRARDLHVRSEPSMVFPAGFAVHGYSTARESSLGDPQNRIKKTKVPISQSTKAITNQKKAEESTSKIKGTRICIAIRSFDNPEKQAWCLPPHTRKVAMPDTRVLYTVLRSPHVDKKSREQFEMRFKKRFLVIKAQSHELSKKLFWLKRYRILGAQYELQFHCKTRLDMTPMLGYIDGSVKSQ